MPLPRRAPLIVAGLLCLVAAGWFAARSTPPATASATTAVVVCGRLVETITATGRVASRTTVEITCKASGMVVAVPIEPGIRVGKGDLLLELDPREESRQHQRTQVAVAAAQARLAQARLVLEHKTATLAVDRQRAQATLASATATAQDARDRAARLAELRRQGLAAVEEEDGARRERAVADAALATATLALAELDARERMLENRRKDVDLAEAALREAELNRSDAEQRLTDTRVTAPIAGTVTRVNVEVGQIIASAISTVGAGTPVMRVVDLSRLQVRVYVPERDIGRLRLGQRAAVAAEAFPGRRFPGTVQRIAAQGGRDGGDQAISFEVVIALEGGDLPLRPEMSAVADITTLDVADALTVPAGAVVHHRGRTTLTLRSPSGATEVREVELGGNDAERQQIVRGVSAGETVLLPAKGSSRWRPDLELGL